MSRIDSETALEALYGAPSRASLVKESAVLTPEYRRLIEASPFFALATAGPAGLDCSPRGELGGAIHIEDEATLLLPDRKGNNRLDSLRNIVRDPRVALLFLIPGSGTTLRINGRAEIHAGAELLARFAVDGRPPRSVVVIRIETVYFQCARAILRAELWNPERHIDPKTLPTPGEILQERSLADPTGERIDAAAYDAEWPGRAAKSLW
ncbi:MAG: pyridoxamine 5'-phosphate oxidase family protein [Alphaproteobacteria bacterium]|nr:pyridoxamine 5'-phosphate oxidase family protein [Alphaproteobacteria bacterium]